MFWSNADLTVEFLLVLPDGRHVVLPGTRADATAQERSSSAAV